MPASGVYRTRLGLIFRVIESVDRFKDVDGFHPYNQGRLLLSEPLLVPCTPPFIT